MFFTPALQLSAAAAGAPAPPLLFHRSIPSETEGGEATAVPPLPPHARPAFDAAACSRLLAGRTRAMGRVLLCAADVGSTQELLQAHGGVLGDGAVVVADRQTSGKGGWRWGWKTHGWLMTFEQHGFEPLREEYLDAWLHSRQQLDFDDTPGRGAAGAGAGAAGRGQGEGGGGGGRRSRLTVLGLSPAGFLLAEDEGGSQYELMPDGNSLDMMQGLIRRKVIT
ncbi:hypothetical protein TSOC_004209 [Tetrabaena socialis]|uniref:Uncharacterized protein n=1 Tax=Tetrabaena socialis TaxID=47790 RepID=A0A2J8A9H7_9CHLO|nr:hypothetical protein TSOC_004209 [Tetrabaena socialis]|eukprot:PNH09182.1 hypothetical protein TSOC_004209 [Tetrabaena socialis]